MIDGLACSAMPAAVERHASRLAMVPIVHALIASDVGIDAATAARRADGECRALSPAQAIVVAGPARRKLFAMNVFDLLGPLPKANSTTVLEASAGTGKTFVLAGLVTRLVAEGAATLGFSSAVAARGLALALLGRGDEACAEASRACDLYPLERDRFGAPYYLATRLRTLAVLGDEAEFAHALGEYLSLPAMAEHIDYLVLDPVFDGIKEKAAVVALIGQYTLRKTSA